MMWKSFCALFKKDFRMLVSGKFFLTAMGFLILYTAYINLGYIRFMKMPIYNVYLYDPAGTHKTVSESVKIVPSKEALRAALLADSNSVGLDAGDGVIQVELYEGIRQTDRHRKDYALSMLQPLDSPLPEVVGSHTLEQKARKEMTCELLFFELSAVGLLGIASVLFKEKSMGVIRVHAILPMQRELFLLSKLAIFLLSDLFYGVLLTLLNVGFSQGIKILPAVLVQTAILSLIMALIGLGCSLLLKDFRQFTLAYLIIAVFVATPVFLSANTAMKLDWIVFHPFYHFYMGLKNAYFETPVTMPAYYIGCLCVIVLLFTGIRLAFRRELEKEE